MKKSKKAMALAMLVTLLLASCGGGTTAEQTTASTADTTAPVETEPVETEINRENAKSVIPDTLDLGGITVKVGYVDLTRFREDFNGEDNGDVVEEAVYLRNLETEEKLNIKIETVVTETKATANAQPFVNAVTAGDHLYDIYNGLQCYTNRHYTKGYFTNMKDDQYIAWDMPWWNVAYMDEVQLNGSRFFLYSDATFGLIRNAGCVYFNQDIMKDKFKKSADDIYQLVFDGKWTFDLYTQYVAEAYTDVNGNGQVDDDDIVGAMGTYSKSVEHYQYPADIRTTAFDKDGKPYFILNNEKTVNFTEKLYKLYYETKGFILTPTDTVLDTDILNRFKNEKSLFLASWFYQSGLLREMEADYGIIPYPKYDEAQENYKSLVHDGVCLMCVPVTISKERLNVIGAVLEEVSYGAYIHVTPAYFDVALKGKYSRDNASSQMLDMIYANVTTNFGYAYNINLKDIGMLRPLIKNQSKDFASWYASSIEASQTALDELVVAFMEVSK